MPCSFHPRKALASLQEVQFVSSHSRCDVQYSLDRRPAKSALAVVAEFQRRLTNQRVRWARDRQATAFHLSQQRCSQAPSFSRELLAATSVTVLPAQIHAVASEPGRIWEYADAVLQAVKSPLERVEELDETVRTFMCFIPQVRASSDNQRAQG